MHLAAGAEWAQRAVHGQPRRKSLVGNRTLRGAGLRQRIERLQRIQPDDRGNLGPPQLRAVRRRRVGPAPASRYTVGGAIRGERFADFGTTINYKGLARYELVAGLAVRGSASSGFRAPTPGQQNAFQRIDRARHIASDRQSGHDSADFARRGGCRRRSRCSRKSRATTRSARLSTRVRSACRAIISASTSATASGSQGIIDSPLRKSRDCSPRASRARGTCSSSAFSPTISTPFRRGVDMVATFTPPKCKGDGLQFPVESHRGAALRDTTRRR